MLTFLGFQMSMIITVEMSQKVCTRKNLAVLRKRERICFLREVMRNPISSRIPGVFEA